MQAFPAMRAPRLEKEPRSTGGRPGSPGGGAEQGGGQGVGGDELVEPQLGRVHAELLGDLVEMDFEGEARLGRAVSALGAAGRLVGERSCALKLVPWDVIRDGL